MARPTIPGIPLTAHELNLTEQKSLRPVGCGTLAANPRPSNPIHWTLHAETASVQHVRVHHRRGDIRVPEKCLHGADVIAGLEEVRRERMSIMPRAA